MPEAEVAPASTDPLHHVRKMAERLRDTRDHLMRDVEKVDDPLFKLMFGEASAVLNRLITAFLTYETRSTREYEQ
ncbi:MAG: hypothetical protein H6R15_3781 [Proteobacteria bacterium]|nr:hypothetical protein [Pseudomonadota bacterium]